MDFINTLFSNINIPGTGVGAHKVLPLDIGPVLGHSTASSVKVWGRSAKRDVQGVVEIRNPENNASIFEVFSFDQALDYTAAIEVKDVKNKLAMVNGNRALQYRVGCIHKSLSLFCYDLNLDWADIDYIPIQLAPFKPDSSFDFVFGSCRHLDTGFFDNQHDDRCFDVIANNKRDYKLAKPDFMLFIGDQVYADHPKAGIFSIFKPWMLQKESHYRSHYHKAWGRPQFSKTVARYPSLMMWDDHEVLNDWNLAEINDKPWKRTAYENGKKYFNAYQSALNPDSYHDGFYYHFEYGMGDFFVMDVRSDKFPDKCLLGDKQKDRFKTWLLDDSNKIKFIVSAIPVAPDADIDQAFNGANDRWDDYPHEREWLFELIETYNVRNPGHPVILLSGDVHCSYGAQIINTVDKDSPLQVYQLVSSGFHWPAPGLSRQHFKFNEKLKVDGKYYSKLTTQFIENGNEKRDKVIVSHNFCHVSVSSEQVVSNWYSEHGRLLRSVAIDISQQGLAGVAELARVKQAAVSG